MPDPEVLIRPELGPEERLLWAGRARGGLTFRAPDCFLVPFALLWCTLIGFGLVSFITQGANSPWLRPLC
jgi:hypothetical protein